MAYVKIIEERFEFLLYINNHIICQRNFPIKDYNEESIKSLEIKELMDSLIGMNNGDFGTLGIIPHYFKQKSKRYCWENFNEYSDKQSEEPIRNIFERIDNFQVEIKVDKKTVAKGEFIGNYFQPKVRYQVDIREIIPQITNEIRYFLSQKNYVTEYENI